MCGRANGIKEKNRNLVVWVCCSLEPTESRTPQRVTRSHGGLTGPWGEAVAEPGEEGVGLLDGSVRPDVEVSHHELVHPWDELLGLGNVRVIEEPVLRDMFECMGWSEVCVCVCVCVRNVCVIGEPVLWDVEWSGEG